MSRVKTQNDEAIYQRVPDACRITGLSQKFLREGCKNGVIPHVMAGNMYMINIPALLQKLNQEGGKP